MATRTEVPEAMRAEEVGSLLFNLGMTGKPTSSFTPLEQTVLPALISNTLNGREKQRVGRLSAKHRKR